MINLYNMDCIDAMKEMEDNQFDLAIVDPPYFSGPELRKYYGNSTQKSKHSKTGKVSSVKRINYDKSKKWKIPTRQYFQELKRVSKHQIIWGVNYYIKQKFGPGRIIWDKVNEKSSFSDVEIAYTDIHDSVRLFRYMWNGMMQGSMKNGSIQEGNKKLNEKRIHPTQKPVRLYEWLLMKYAKKGDKILDTHCGSGSSMIACEKLGFDLEAYELDKKHFNAANKRFKEQTAQLRLL